jgi:hypothetical protein
MPRGTRSINIAAARSARNTLTDREEGHSLNHQQDRAKDLAWNDAEAMSGPSSETGIL